LTQETDQGTPDRLRSEEWRKFLLEGHAVYRWLRNAFRAVPASPRCGTCFAPFRGIGGKILSVTPYRPSRKNPRFCKLCCEHQPLGGAEVDTGVLFADMRGYTAVSEKMRPEEVAHMMNRFYGVASDVLVAHDALIDKLMGDEVMALFLPGFSGREYLSKMVSAAEALLGGLGYSSKEGPWLPVGIGLDYGSTWVGNVGSPEVNDFTALGDVVNTAARLQAEARPGQIVMSERVYGIAGASLYPAAAPMELTLKGKAEPVPARIVEVRQRDGSL